MSVTSLLIAVTLGACSTAKPYPATYSTSDSTGVLTIDLREGGSMTMLARSSKEGRAPVSIPGTYTVVGDSVFLTLGRGDTQPGKFENGGLRIGDPTGRNPKEIVFRRDD